MSLQVAPPSTDRDVYQLYVRKAFFPFCASAGSATLLVVPAGSSSVSRNVVKSPSASGPGEGFTIRTLDSGPGGLSREHDGHKPDADGRPAHLQTIAVSVLGDPDRELGEHFDRISRAQPTSAASTRAVYLEMLELFRPRFAAAVAAVADAAEGGVVVHCHAGKDRTGLVVALLLDVAGVEPAAIAADYALSAANLAISLAAWFHDADDEDDREHRRRVGASPEQAMVDVLETLADRYGGSAQYLLGSGLTEDDLVRVRARLGGSGLPARPRS